MKPNTINSDGYIIALVYAVKSEGVHTCTSYVAKKVLCYKMIHVSLLGGPQQRDQVKLEEVMDLTQVAGPGMNRLQAWRQGLKPANAEQVPGGDDGGDG